MRFEGRVKYQNLLSVSEVTMAVGRLWWHIFGTILAEPIVFSALPSWSRLLPWYCLLLWYRIEWSQPSL